MCNAPDAEFLVLAVSSAHSPITNRTGGGAGALCRGARSNTPENMEVLDQLSTVPKVCKDDARERSQRLFPSAKTADPVWYGMVWYGEPKRQHAIRQVTEAQRVVKGKRKGPTAVPGGRRFARTFAVMVSAWLYITTAIRAGAAMAVPDLPGQARPVQPSAGLFSVPDDPTTRRLDDSATQRLSPAAQAKSATRLAVDSLPTTQPHLPRPGVGVSYFRCSGSDTGMRGLHLAAAAAAGSCSRVPRSTLARE